MKKIAYMMFALLLIGCATGNSASGDSGKEAAEETAPAAGETILSIDFESGDASGWESRGPVTLTVTGDAAYEGSKSLLTTGRQDNWNGPAIKMKKFMKAGKTYQVSVWVMIKEGQSDNDLIITAEKKTGTETGWDRIAQASGIAGEWVNLTGEYEMHSADSLTVYVESPDAGLSYYIDGFEVKAVN